MAEEEKKEKQQPEEQLKELGIYFQNFLASIPAVDPVALNTSEMALQYLKERAQKVPEQLSNAAKNLKDLIQETTNIKGIDVNLKSWRLLDMKMHIMREADIPLKKDIIGIGRIESIRLSKLIHLQAEIGEGNNDIRMHIREGMAVVVNVVFVGQQVIPLKGTAKLVRDAKGQFLLETSTYVPGTDVPVTLSIPLRQVFDEVRKQKF